MKLINLTTADKYLDLTEIQELIASELDNSYGDEDGELNLDIENVSQVSASGYGHWRTIVTINGRDYSHLHTSEEWYYSQKGLYNDQYDRTPEVIANHNSSVWHCIKSYLTDIIDDNKNNE
jgi:hypothetical protein